VVGTPVVRLESLSDARVPLSISIEREELGHPVELELVVEDVTHHETKTSPIRFLTPFGTAGTSHD
jgi:hypothetical protein